LVCYDGTQVDGPGPTALFRAALSGFADVVSLLIEHGAESDTNPVCLVSAGVAATWASHALLLRVSAQ
jgi:hypothetical protein